MSGPGYVTTARGEILNMDQLIREQTKRPLTKAERDSLKSEIKPTKRPRTPINVRGHMPLSGAEKAPQVQPAAAKAVPEHPTMSSSGSSETDKTLADFTSIKVDKPMRLKEKPESAGQASQEILSDIMKELEANAPHSREAAEQIEKEEYEEKQSASRKKS